MSRELADGDATGLAAEGRSKDGLALMVVAGWSDHGVCLGRPFCRSILSCRRSVTDTAQRPLCGRSGPMQPQHG